MVEVERVPANTGDRVWDGHRGQLVHFERAVRFFTQKVGSGRVLWHS